MYRSIFADPGFALFAIPRHAQTTLPPPPPTVWFERTSLDGGSVQLLQNAYVLAAYGIGPISPIPHHRKDLTRYALCSRWSKMLYNALALASWALRLCAPETFRNHFGYTTDNRGNWRLAAVLRR